MVRNSFSARGVSTERIHAKELSLGSDAVVQTDDAQHEQATRLVDHAVQSPGLGSTIISLGMVATELVYSIAEPDIAVVIRKRYESAVPAEAFARTVALAISQREDGDINEIPFRPTSQEY
jgi:NADP-dependent 3-hydroxy acid dehydrogenase YdfG